ncbi:MAG: hypothetical protein J2P22_20305 [Nocardioides sp.]|nr:hypothetical protein [Nocardioides sp.]
MGRQQDDNDDVAHGEGQDGPMSVPDEDLPEDLQPTEDNPLAQPADDDVPDDVVLDGDGVDTSGEDSDED